MVMRRKGWIGIVSREDKLRERGRESVVRLEELSHCLCCCSSKVRKVVLSVKGLKCMAGYV